MNNPHCQVCDHCIVDGVACDGPTTDCSKIGSTTLDHNWNHASARLEPVIQADITEYDAIRSCN